MLAMRHIQYGNTTIAFTVRRTRRKKTIALQVQPDLQVVILVPPFLRDETVKQLVLKRARWIVEKREKLKRLRANMPKKEFVSGEAFPYLGRRYRLKVIRSEKEKGMPCLLTTGRFVVQIDKRLNVKMEAEAVRQKLAAWYRDRAIVKIPERVERFAGLVGKIPKEIVIRNQEKRWGSCSRSDILRFNWKIIMAPVSVLDYVVVHELCHLVHSNHSPEFWHVVESIIPDYQEKRNWLKANSTLLSFGLF